MKNDSDRENLFFELDSIIETTSKGFVELVANIGLTPDRDFIGSDMEGLNLAKANLTKFDLSGANLRYADLSHATLASVSLRGSDLSGANLENANLRGADLTNANLAGAELTNADLFGAKTKNTNFLGVLSVGDDVIYPSHGVGHIKAIEKREIVRDVLDMYVVSFEKDRLVLRVPVRKATESGMRKLTTKAKIQSAMNALKSKPRRKRKVTWRSRAQEYENKINSDNIALIAEVVQELHADEDGEQSYSERQMYRAALERLAMKVAEIKSIDANTAEELQQLGTLIGDADTVDERQQLGTLKSVSH